jgi:hypothetical protein
LTVQRLASLNCTDTLLDTIKSSWRVFWQSDVV